MKWIIFLFFSQSLFAQKFSTQELLKLGEKHASLIKSQLYTVEGFESGVKQAKLLANPILTFQGGSIKTGTQSGAVADISLNQPIPWLGKRSARIKSQEFLLSLAELDKEETRLSVLHRIHLLSLQLAATQEIEKHYTERKERFSLIQRFLNTRPFASPKAAIEKDLIETQIRIIEKNMMVLISEKAGLLWELEMLTGAKIGEVTYEWKDNLVLPNKGYFLDRFERSPTARRLKINENLFENKIEEARLEARPDILVGVNYRQENVAPVNHFYHGQVSVVIPILDYGQHAVGAARANLRRTEALNEVEKNRAYALIHSQFATLMASHKGTQIFPYKKVHEMENKFLKADSAFRKGQIDALTFLQSDTQVHESIDQIFMTRVEYHQSLSALNLLIGAAPEL